MFKQVLKVRMQAQDLLARSIRRFIVSKLEEIPFIVFVSFLLTFVLTRAYVYIAYKDIPNLTFLIDRIVINGIHVHHLNFGIIMLSIIGFQALYDIRRTYHRRLAFLYGIALALTFDEFSMWLKLEDDYYSRVTYNAIVIICLIFLNIIYFPHYWRRMGKQVRKTVSLKSLLDKVKPPQADQEL